MFGDVLIKALRHSRDEEQVIFWFEASRHLFFKHLKSPEHAKCCSVLTEHTNVNGVPVFYSDVEKSLYLFE